MHDFFRTLAGVLPGGPVVLATVVKTRGSTPRQAGARMAVTPSGLLAGTIGGGKTEGRVLELARGCLEDGEPRMLEADLRGDPREIRDGICGGTMTIALCRLTVENAGTEVRAVISRLAAGQTVSLLTRSSAARPLAVGDADGDGYRVILLPDPRVLIVGAGHIGRCLAACCDILGFRVTVQDERSEWLEPAAFPAACRLVESLPGAMTDLRDWQGGRYAVLVTRGFPQDLAALSLLRRETGLTYVGLLGSRKRVATVLSALREAGEPDFPPGILHAPVGVEIAAETPDEIAVSIAAEMIRVRRRENRIAPDPAAP